MREQTFEKREMTSTDVISLCHTLWTGAEHIRCAPQSRLSFHLAVLICAMGGFRPGVVLGLTYGSVKLELVRDPTHPKQRTLVAHIAAEHNKQRKLSIKHTQHRV